MLRGSPQTSFTYLDRAVHEPPPAADTADLLSWTGAVAQLVDWRIARHYLSRALQVTTDPEARAGITEMLARALFILGRNRDAVELYEQAIALLDTKSHTPDMRQRLEAGLINVTIANAELRESGASLVACLQAEPTGPGMGGRCLDALIGWYAAITAKGLPEQAMTRTLRAVSGGTLIDQANGTEALADAEWTLIAADHEQALPTLDAALADAHRRGTTPATAVALTFRSLAWYRRGQLAEAEADAAQAMQMCTTAHVDVLRPLLAAFYADTMIESGGLDRAQDILDWATSADLPATASQWYWTHATRSRLLLHRGRTEEGLKSLLECGRRFEAHGWHNPSFLNWRPEAALALHALGRIDEARTLVTDDLRLARQWGAPWALGKALRVTGLLTGGDTGVKLLQEAVSVLSTSPARLEYANALADSGAALRRAGQRATARAPLRQALALATQCGADPLIKQVRSELAAAGGRFRRTDLTGPGALSPSERRVAELAASGRTNKQIAQQLFVTTKTVEVHLSAAYRKLGITTRAALAAALSPSSSQRSG